MIRSGIGVTLFCLFMFSWVELLLSRTLTATNAQPIASIMTRTSTASGIDWGTLAAAAVLTIIPGIVVVYFVRNHIAKGFALGRTREEQSAMERTVWTKPTSFFFAVIAALLLGMSGWEWVSPSVERRGFLPLATTRGDRLFMGLLSAAYMHLAVVGFTNISIWFALGAAVLWTLVLMRWG